MGFAFLADDSGRSKIIVKDEGEHIMPLPIAPACFDDCLKAGKWLVVNMSVWNAVDRGEGARALKLLRHGRGEVRLGLRPFDYPEEFAPWLPALRTTDFGQVECTTALQNDQVHVTIKSAANSSPIWVAISDGNIVAVRMGQLADEEIEALISQLL